MDFLHELAHGVRKRMADQPPEAMAGVEIIVNTRRAQRRLQEIFRTQGPLFLPQISTISEMSERHPDIHISPARSRLSRHLTLAHLVGLLLEKEPDLAPASSVFDLADSLATVLDDLNDEGLDPAALVDLDVSEHSEYWRRSLKFLGIATGLLASSETDPKDETGRLREFVDRLTDKWSKSPPDHPVIVAGSTGSRGTTAKLMGLVACLPQGAVVLPGFDFEMSAKDWTRLNSEVSHLDHPQFRFAKLAETLGVSLDEVERWSGDAPSEIQVRNRLVSLSLQPAPYTSRWLQDGPKIEDLDQALRNANLIEARDQRQEATAIALVLRKAAEDGKSAALITPDINLTKRVRETLARWNIEPDASIGRSLIDLPAGRLLVQLAESLSGTLSNELFFSLLKNPFCALGGGPESRKQHIDTVRTFELFVRKHAVHTITQSVLSSWMEKSEDTYAARWIEWIGISLLKEIEVRGKAPDPAALEAIFFDLCSGPEGSNPAPLLSDPDGEQILQLLDDLKAETPLISSLPAFRFGQLVQELVAGADIRNPVTPHPDIKIWGTLEARSQKVDVCVLGGLNEGIWPRSPSHDPWLNRDLRKQIGMPVPETQIGLSAHDFQQSIAASEVFLCRSLRDADADTVPSRWLNRITNLLQGLPSTGRKELTAMRERGAYWLNIASGLDEPAKAVATAPRPSPVPPGNAPLDRLSVTEIAKLVRDPYAIYAKYVLKLRPLNPLVVTPDARLRGIALHKVMEALSFVDLGDDTDLAQDHLEQTALTTLAQHVPWEASRAFWTARLLRAGETFIPEELARRRVGKIVEREVSGSLRLPEVEIKLVGTADRLDETEDGRIRIFDYKSGKPPSKKEMEYYDKQLVLEALMVERGAFEKVGARPVLDTTYIGLGSAAECTTYEMSGEQISTAHEQLLGLIREYQFNGKGFSSRRSMLRMTFDGDYDHLARYGEWDETNDAEEILVGDHG